MEERMNGGMKERIIDRNGSCGQLVSFAECKFQFNQQTLFFTHQFVWAIFKC